MVRAAHRFDQVSGRRLAAAVTYYGFFAVFALVLLGFAVLGYVIDDPAVESSVESYLAENLPRLDLQALRQARGAVGLVASVSLLVIGLLWVDALRSSIRAIWRIEEYPGRFLFRYAIDLLALLGLGLLLAVSLGLAIATATLLNQLAVAAGGVDYPPVRQLLSATGFLLGLGVNTLLSVAVLTLLPRLRMPLRRVAGPALLIAVGLEVAKLVGRAFVHRMETNPAFQVAAGTAGLLLFLLVLNELILFAAALTATSRTGRVVDLATANSSRGAPGRRRPRRRVGQRPDDEERPEDDHQRPDRVVGQEHEMG